MLLLLHGWPDDATTWDEAAPALNAAGYRTVAPWLRGFGATRFLSASERRTGNGAVLAIDAIEIAEMMAVGWPDRISRIAMLSTPSRLGGLKTPPFLARWSAVVSLVPGD